jgi:dihydropteroate synthase
VTASIADILQSHLTGRAVVMGVLNVTPDSFSDGGRFLRPADAIGQADLMLTEGADIIDIGAESSRPGSDPVSAAEQINRLREILPAVVDQATVSIDTTVAAVAEFAAVAGVSIINDTSAGLDDPAMLPLAARLGKPIVLMHRLSRPNTMQQKPSYQDVVEDVRRHLSERMEAALAAGVRRENIILDPGIGFGKTMEHNISLLDGVGRLAELGRPVVVGASRKAFIGALSGEKKPRCRLGGTIAAHLAAWRRGATIFRVHDVAAMVQALAVAAAIEGSGGNRHRKA